MKTATATDDEYWMRKALAEARRAARRGEVPVGAVIIQHDVQRDVQHGVRDGVRENAIVGRGFNRREVGQNPLAHAELIAIRQAARKLRSWRLVGCSIYVTLEPCAMCAGALVNSRIDRLVFGASDPKGGYCGTLGDVVRDTRLNHRLEVVGGVLAQDAARQLRDFFSSLRGKKTDL